MNNRVARHRERRGRMKTFFDNHAAYIDPHTDIKQIETDFNKANETWEGEAVVIKGMEENDNAATKAAAIEDLANICAKWGQRCKVKARQRGLNNLVVLLDHEKSDFYLSDVRAAIDLAQAMRDGLNSNLAAFKEQKLDPVIIAEIDSRIAGAHKVMDLPVSAGNTLSTLREQQAAGDAALELQLEDIVGLLRAEYRDTDKPFVAEMLTQYALGASTGKRYTGIEGKAPAGHTVRRADDLAKSSAADMDGAYSIKGMKGGAVTFELVNPAGDVVGTRMLRLKLGTVVVMDWAV